MNVGIELRQPVLGESGGVALLLRGIFKELLDRHPGDQFTVFCTDFNRDLLSPAGDHVRVQRLPTRNFFKHVDMIAKAHPLEVLFRSFPVDAELAFPIEKQVFLIPDIQHEQFPQFFTPEELRLRRKAFNQALASAGALGTLSEYARQTIRDHAWTYCQDIFLMSPAMPIEHHQPSHSRLTAKDLALLPRGEFFLYPANLWPHKNHRRVLQAFELFLQQTGRKIEFIFTGYPRGWPELQAEFAALPIRHLGFVPTQLLQLLCQRARAVVFFSLYEGFGMPLLEAFDAGTPVICSNTTSLPEVGGDAVLTCPPTDIRAISELMSQVAQDDQLRADLVTRGTARLRQYSWERSSQELYAAFERVARADRPAHSYAEHTRQAEPDDSQLPLVSIVTPSYNQGRFLKRTIESVLNQSYPNIEYIVIDGGSTDETLDILESYGQRFQWISEPDRGQTDAINKGFARSNGCIRAYLNSDDVLLPNAVETVVGHFRTHADCDLVYGRAKYIDANDTVTGMYNTADYSFARLMRDNCICQPAAFWRSRIAKQIGPYNDQLHYAMDYEYWIRIDRAGGKIEHIPDILAASRLYAETKTLSARGAIYQEIFQVCQAQAGYVDYAYFAGLWQHLCWERQDGWPRRLRNFPRFRPIMARLDYWWYHRKRYTPKYFAKIIKDRALTLYHQEVRS